MPVAWFFAPYQKRPGRPIRECAMNDFTAQITADGGAWSESEVLGDQAIVKVNAATATIQAIAADARFDRIPAALRLLNDPLSSLSAAQRTAIRNKILSLGYTQAEIDQRLPDLSVVTLGDVLRFVCRRRKKARYDEATDTIVLDGPEQVCRTPESVDAAV